MHKILQTFCFLLVFSSLACKKTTPSKSVSHSLKKGPLVYRSVWPGEFLARNSQKIFSPNLNGDALTVASVLEDGSKVKAGDTILSFDDAILKQEILLEQAKEKIAQAELDKTREELNIRQINLESSITSIQILLKQAEIKKKMSGSLVSKLEAQKLLLDIKKLTKELQSSKEALNTFKKQRKASLKVKELELESVQKKVKEKEDFLSQMQVKAPVDGVLYAPYTRLNFVHSKAVAGTVVRPGDKILEIPDLSSYNLLIHLRQKDASLLKVSDQLTVYPSIDPKRALQAKVTKKQSFGISYNERLGLKNPYGSFKEFELTLEVEGDMQDIRPGNTARVEVELLLKKEALLIPLAFVKETKSGHEVYLDKEKTKTQKITLGQSSSSHAEVVSGLSATMQVFL